jgi:methyltransferase (TIGR00027 family)
MTTEGIKGLFIETRDWRKTVAFWKALGYVLEFETDHHSGQLRHPSGGPFLFIVERAEGSPLELQPMLEVGNAQAFLPPSSGKVVRPFELQHRGVLELLLADPDGREIRVQAPPKRWDVDPQPDNTAVRVALWRALHVLNDAPPHVFDDTLGLLIADPDPDWRQRPDMSEFTRPFRASIVARARFVEDMVEEQVASGLAQYVILGAGLDTFAQRRPELASRMRVFEVDQPEPQAWKRRRLRDAGRNTPPFLTLVPVDFEGGEGWLERMDFWGFEAQKPALVSSLGVSMYLTREAIATTLRQVAGLAPGSTLVMSFLLPIEQADPELRPGLEAAARGAAANGTPFVSYLMPEELLAMAREAGFKEVVHVSADALAERYFSSRTDGLRPPRNCEELLVART